MLTEERFTRILSILESMGSVTVQQLMTELDASESTIRRDLNTLDANGQLIKVHGGAILKNTSYKIHIYPKFVGECNDNTLQKTWQDETLPRMERIRLKESRKGLPFRDWFHFLHKNFGLGTAIVRSITPYIRIILGTKTRYSGA